MMFSGSHIVGCLSPWKSLILIRCPCLLPLQAQGKGDARGASERIKAALALRPELVQLITVGEALSGVPPRLVCFAQEVLSPQLSTFYWAHWDTGRTCWGLSADESGNDAAAAHLARAFALQPTFAAAYNELGHRYGLADPPST